MHATVQTRSTGLCTQYWRSVRRLPGNAVQTMRTQYEQAERSTKQQYCGCTRDAVGVALARHSQGLRNSDPCLGVALRVPL
eukprot:1254962-Rhodomonas_salina.2